MSQQKPSTTHNIPVWGIFLLFLGIVFLLQTLNILPWSLWSLSALYAVPQPPVSSRDGIPLPGAKKMPAKKTCTTPTPSYRSFSIAYSPPWLSVSGRTAGSTITCRRNRRVYTASFIPAPGKKSGSSAGLSAFSISCSTAGWTFPLRNWLPPVCAR